MIGRGKIIAITIIAAFDAFFLGFALGFNSKHALVENPGLPPVTVKTFKADLNKRRSEEDQIKYLEKMIKTNIQFQKTRLKEIF